MPYTLTDDMIAELKEIAALRVADETGGCPFSGAASINPCPVCGED